MIELIGIQLTVNLSTIAWFKSAWQVFCLKKPININKMCFEVSIILIGKTTSFLCEKINKIFVVNYKTNHSQWETLQVEVISKYLSAYNDYLYTYWMRLIIFNSDRNRSKLSKTYRFVCTFYTYDFIGELNNLSHIQRYQK